MARWIEKAWLGMALLTQVSACAGQPPSVAATATPLEGFVQTNGVRLQYLDYGGSGPFLILIHGLADDPHSFDDLAPAFTDQRHVIAYARRGSGSSDARGPYDDATLAADLLGLMDALKIARADLAGTSAGGNEVTRVAGERPERVRRVVYLDAAYDWTDPDFRAAYQARPAGDADEAARAMVSFDAFRSHEKSNRYSQLDSMRRVESYLREKVVILPDGSLKERMPPQVREALYSALFANAPRNYRRMRCPVLAIYAEHYYDVFGPGADRRTALLEYERAYWDAFQKKSMARLQSDLPAAQLAQVRGAHGNFLLISRDDVVRRMRRFLLDTESQ
jgi:pimeloyl-ACP methyl ester carboxylesterase